jgi:DNA-binding CsgD family transcriptional regulator
MLKSYVPLPRSTVSSPFEERLEEFDALIHLIYSAVANPDLWSQVVGAVAHSLGADKALLFTPFTRPQDGGMAFPWQISEDHLAQWATKYLDHDIWAHTVVQKGLMHNGSVYTDQDLVPTKAFRESAFYVEFLSQIGIGQMCGGIISEGEPGMPATSLSVFRSPDDPIFGAIERRWISLVLPHLSRALGLTQRLSFKRHRLQSLRLALDRLSVGVVLLNEALELVFTNRMAHGVFERDDGLFLRNRRLMSRRPSQVSEQQLDVWLAVLCSAEPARLAELGDTLNVPRSEPSSRYCVQCCPLEIDSELGGTEDAKYVVFITDPDHAIWPSPEVLQRKLGLTASESRVALLLAQGSTYRALADTLSIAEETARSHVKNIYAKTRINQKAVLTRLVLSLATAAV